MKTLVIHPKDSTTDFLKVIYKDHADWTIVTDATVSKAELKKLIKNHQRIIMLGHGTEDGLIGSFTRRIVDSTLVYLLRTKVCVCVWCNADVFVKRYELTGFYTGMIISDAEEALMFCLRQACTNDIENSNVLFATSIRDSINETDILDTMKSKYVAPGNPVVDFNKDNLYFR